ncbi:rhodanese-like domain-containing protein [Algicola sagamiensis]|uniref:rhodanese-like domain-containing protein n=1 Tax=Algicola sagamiensis TaxID=163869 RepID=UPI00037D2DC9|nr:rhodanese-like domain-containing protein [Algicola sagamiensis]
MEQFIEFLGRHPFLTTAWVGLFLALVYSYVKSAMSPVKGVNPQELSLMVNREDAILVDIRPDKDYQKSHIANAEHVSLEKIMKNDFGKLESKKQAPIIVICAAGVSASQAAGKMVKAGFEKVHILSGGMNAWTNANLPVTKK